MTTLSITLIVILIVAVAYIAFLHTNKIKDEDNDFIPDAVEKATEKAIATVEERVARVKEEVKDVATAIKEVGNQIDDIPAAVTGKNRAGRRKASK